MKVKLLLLCNPDRYPDGDGDVPCFYRAAAGHPDLEPLHLAAELVTGKPPSQWCVTPVSAGLDQASFLRLNQESGLPFEPGDIDAVFCRTLKPFAEGYLRHLTGIESQVRFLNRPSSKIQQLKPHFLSALAGSFMPPHLVSGDPRQIEAFVETHGQVVAKQSNSTQAQGVFRLHKTNNAYQVQNARGQCSEYESLTICLDQLQHGIDGPLQFMRFLPRTSEGDKRVVVLDGQILGAYRRRSATGNWVNNVAMGGLCDLDHITDEERHAIEATWPCYASLGLRILGYDFLQDDAGLWRVSEINVGNVGGFSRLQQLGGGAALNELLSWIVNFARASAPLEIREAQPRDDAAIAAIYQSAIDQGGITMDDCQFQPNAVAEKREQLQPRGCLLVATRLGEVVGWGQLMPYSQRVGYSHCAETSVYVHPSVQGQGLGTQLQRQLLETAQSKGYAHLVAKVVAGNHNSIRFHESFGYEIVGTQRRIGYLRGRWYDVTILQRIFP